MRAHTRTHVFNIGKEKPGYSMKSNRMWDGFSRTRKWKVYLMDPDLLSYFKLCPFGEKATFISSFNIWAETMHTSVSRVRQNALLCPFHKRETPQTKHTHTQMEHMENSFPHTLLKGAFKRTHAKVHSWLRTRVVYACLFSPTLSCFLPAKKSFPKPCSKFSGPGEHKEKKPNGSRSNLLPCYP